MEQPRQNRRVTTTASAALMVTIMAVGTSCFPEPVTPPPAPTLPAGVGFEWIRDTGGSTSEGGTYTPGYSRLRLLDGVVDGPNTVSPSDITFGGTFGVGAAEYSLPVYPDGTAKFPWNGFAGEGITTTVTTIGGPTGTTTTYEVTGPEGPCSFSNVSTTYATPKTSAAIPSPDGTKLAAFTLVNDFDANRQITDLAVYELGPTCSLIDSVSYTRQSYAGQFTGEKVLSSLTVWAPDSSAIIYPVGSGLPGAGSRLERLAADGSSAPTVLVDDPDSTVIPLGWSAAGRVLFLRQTRGAGTSTTVASSIETVAAGGGPSKVIDDQTSAAPMTDFTTHFGYFVPGTSQVLYTGGSRTTTLGGSVWAWPQIRLHDDTTGGDGPVPETDAPLATHLAYSGEAPNVEFIERFVR